MAATSPNGSEDTIATAGHCVYSHSSGSYEDRGVQVWPGRDGAAAPFGSCAVIDMWAPPEWINGALPRYDHGAMKLDCTVGNVVGWFDLWWQVEPLDGTTISLNGYPCDTGFGEQWTSTNFVHETQERAIYSEINTFSCQSGSPVYTEDIVGCAGICVVAIHVARNSAFSIHNRITEDVYDNLMTFASS